jgi:hypothetical protein
MEHGLDPHGEDQDPHNLEHGDNRSRPASVMSTSGMAEAYRRRAGGINGARVVAGKVEDLDALHQVTSTRAGQYDAGTRGGCRTSP